MTNDSHLRLLNACVARMHSDLLPQETEQLQTWWSIEKSRDEETTHALLASNDAAAWEKIILDHPAHRHPFYNLLATEMTVREYAAFLLENWAYPSFLSLVDKTLAAQITERGRAAIRQNIADEHVPLPHADLMRRLFLAVKRKAGDDVPLAMYPSLADRTLIFYYGYYCNPWNLIGALFATEVMAHHRILHMGQGLSRLGFTGEDCEFIHIHLASDDDHARDWREGVIETSIAAQPSLRTSIAEGIAACLDSSRRYLDDLVRRADAARGARPQSEATNGPR